MQIDETQKRNEIKAYLILDNFKNKPKFEQIITNNSVMANYTIDEIMNTINGINNKYIQTTYNFIISQGEGVIDAMYDQIKKNSGSNKRESRGRDGSKEENRDDSY